MTSDQEIIDKYKTIGSPIAFSSPQKIYHYYKKTVPLNRIKKILSGVDTYTLFRQIKKPKPFNPTFVYFPRKRWDVDLGIYAAIEVGYVTVIYY